MTGKHSGADTANLDGSMVDTISLPSWQTFVLSTMSSMPYLHTELIVYGVYYARIVVGCAHPNIIRHRLTREPIPYDYLKGLDRQRQAAGKAAGETAVRLNVTLNDGEIEVWGDDYRFCEYSYI